MDVNAARHLSIFKLFVGLGQDSCVKAGRRREQSVSPIARPMRSSRPPPPPPPPGYSKLTRCGPA
jgi:hypothetical protein